MTVAVTGATGQLGRLTIARLKTLLPAGEIVALARNPEKAADLGVEARAFDYDRPETLATALQGVDRLLLISSSEVGKRAAQHRAVIEAAKAAGVFLGTQAIGRSGLGGGRSMALPPDRHRLKFIFVNALCLLAGLWQVWRSVVPRSGLADAAKQGGWPA